MLFEKIIFTILALYLLLVTLFKLIKKIDQIYIPILVMQGLGLILQIIELIFDLRFNIFLKVIMYVISIIVPIVIIIMEHKGKNLSEVFYRILVGIYEMTRKYQKMQRNIDFTYR